MNKQQLETMKVAELRKLAVSEGVVYYNKSEKRKMNKAELVATLVNHFEVKVVESAPVTNMKVDLRKKINLTKKEVVVPVVEFENMTPVELVKHFKSLATKVLDGKNTRKVKLQIYNMKKSYEEALVKVKPKLTDRRNKLLVHQWSLTMNQVKALIKQTENKISRLPVTV